MADSISIVMDPIEQIHPEKDSSFALMLAAQARGMVVYYVHDVDLFIESGRVYAKRHRVVLRDEAHDWFEIQSSEVAPLAETDAVFMRKDPPFTMDYVYLTHCLDLVAAEGTPVINNPQSIRDCNEKLFTAWFADCCPRTLVTRQTEHLLDFLRQEQQMIVKPLDGMGGAGVFYVQADDVNQHSIFAQLTQNGSELIMAQQFIPEIKTGDKRIILINGEPMPYALLRIPTQHEVRANLAAGGRGEVVALTERDQALCNRVGPVLKSKGLLWVGLDVIGGYITEINVTSPTCVREIEAATDLKICEALLASVL